jgi:dTMP kinase
MLIVFEGIDGSGKSKQSELTYKYLKDKKTRCILTREPTDGPIGMIIRRVLEEDMEFDPYSFQLLFTADRAYHINTLIRPTIENDTAVISNRYVLSTIAYGMAAGLDKKWLIDMNSKFPEPDITFIFDLKPEEAMDRIHRRAVKFVEKTVRYGHSDLITNKKERRGTEFFEKVEFLKKVREHYRQMAMGKKNVHLIDASKDINEVQKEVRKRIERIMI